MLFSLVFVPGIGVIGESVVAAANTPTQNVSVGRTCTWKSAWSGSGDIMEDRKSPKTDIVLAAWQDACTVKFTTSKQKRDRTAALQILYKGKWVDHADDGIVLPNGQGSFVLNDDLDYWTEYCDYRKFNYRVVVKGKGAKTEIINQGGLLFFFSEDYYDCQPGGTDWIREYYNLGADPDANACWNVKCPQKGALVFSHESRKWTGDQNAAGKYKCRWYKFYTYKDGSQAPSKLESEWWSSSKSCS